MDTSETYIKMCDCHEIQIRTPEDGVGGTFVDGNFIYHTQSQWDKENDGAPEGTYWFMDEEFEEECPTCGNKESHHRTVKCIWLPRQDQLQEMLAFKGVPIMSIAWVGYCASLLNSNIGLKCTSMEQLWLAFVMKEKFNKTWDGEKYVIK